MNAMHDCLDRMFQVEDDDLWQINKTRKAVEEWLQVDGRDLSAEALSALLTRVLTRTNSGSGHQSGKATFCAMSPMRSIPFKVIALLGMDEAGFPRSDRHCGFDLIDQFPRRGDRVGGDEDRSILLETILCATQNLIITWSHSDPCTGRDMAPAVPVTELCDVLTRSFMDLEPFLQEHPLHPFSPISFGRAADGSKSPPWSLDPSLLRAAQALDGENTAPEPMLGGALAPAEPLSTVDLDTLIKVLECPVASLLRDRLQIRLWKEKTTLLDREALEMDKLAAWISQNELLRELRKGEDSERVYELQEARSILSPGTLGVVDFADNMAELMPVLEAAEGFALDAAERIRIDLEISRLRITGSIGSIHGDTCLRIQAGKIKPKHQLDTWIRQLLLSAAQPERAFHSVMLSPKIQVQLEALGSTAEERSLEARSRLEELVAIFRRSASEPVQIFPEAGLSYAAQRAKGRDDNTSMKAARKKWAEDLKNLFMAHAYGSNSLLDDVQQTGDFQVLSDQVFGPLIRAGGKPI